jgi:hypothetical protein
MGHVAVTQDSWGTASNLLFQDEVANALTSILQRIGVEDAPAESTLTLGLLTHALRRAVWVGGFALMIFSFLLQAVAPTSRNSPRYSPS